jgi:hypothetical protein
LFFQISPLVYWKRNIGNIRNKIRSTLYVICILIRSTLYVIRSTLYVKRSTLYVICILIVTVVLSYSEMLTPPMLSAVRDLRLLITLWYRWSFLTCILSFFVPTCLQWLVKNKLVLS